MSPTTRAPRGGTEPPRTVAAHYPDHVWNVDLTAVPIRGGFWSPLMPFALPQVWPFCWWIAAAVDMFSRKAMGFAVFKRPPTSRQIQEFLERPIEVTGVEPEYVVTDKVKQFDCPDFAEAWCELPGIKAPSTLPRARFLIERVKGGLKVTIKDRPKTEETIPDKALNESIWRAAHEYCARHFDEWTGGRARGLGLRFQAALAGK